MIKMNRSLRDLGKLALLSKLPLKLTALALLSQAQDIRPSKISSIQGVELTQKR